MEWYNLDLDFDLQTKICSFKILKNIYIKKMYFLANKTLQKDNAKQILYNDEINHAS